MKKIFIVFGHHNTSGSFKNCKQVVWGGGEPTLDKSFDLIIKEIHKNANPDLYHRVFTNSVRYHPTIEKLLKQGLIKIVTSVDAGTKEKFKLNKLSLFIYQVLYRKVNDIAFICMHMS